jgi:DNA invertase Pin-like site-specific DNA recombinase
MPTTKKAYSYIRFSTKEQAKGDSLRRQVEEAQRYADENDLALDTTVRLYDPAKSSYLGDHIKAGTALGGFLKSIENGDIEK